MKIVILHWVGTCPHCNKFSPIYVYYYRDDDGVKLPNGFKCGNCNQLISEDEFDKILDIQDGTTSGEFRLE